MARRLQRGSAHAPLSAWLSGSSCVGATDGSFGTWRGTPSTFATTWSDDSYDNASNAYQFWSGFDYENWNQSADWACGGIWSSDGDTWALGASGGMDTKWTAVLTNIKNYWTSKSRGTLYIRFAHEMNGNWFDWSVGDTQITDFKAAWARFYNLKQSIFPAARLVFGTNGDTVGHAYDWRDIWPGDQYVDVYATDWYGGHYKLAITNGTAYDGNGGPIGLPEHRQFAHSHGKPIGISEWACDSLYGTGDDPAYIQYMHDFFSAYGGTGAGNLLYEAYFNLDAGYSNNFQIFYPSGTGTTHNPNAAARYIQLF